MKRNNNSKKLCHLFKMARRLGFTPQFIENDPQGKIVKIDSYPFDFEQAKRFLGKKLAQAKIRSEETTARKLSKKIAKSATKLAPYLRDENACKHMLIHSEVAVLKSQGFGKCKKCDENVNQYMELVG